MRGILRIYGKVVKVSGVYVEAYNTEGAIGDLVEIITSDGDKIRGEIIGFSEDRCIVMPFGHVSGIKAEDKVYIRRERVSTYVGEELLGKVVDPFGASLFDGKILSKERMPIDIESINPLERQKITHIFDTGVRSINALFTLGKGQKIGIFAGAGVGKSTLLGMITKFSEADVVVMALIGERGREVKEYVEDVIGEGLRKSVVVVSTADQPPIVKVKGAISAIAHARYFASKGLNVLFIMDSITRFAMAQREVGLAAGEPPTLKGYTPSVFYLMSKIVESCGAFTKAGSITGIFSVLVEGDDISLDPVADSLMGVLDGHIILSRKRANMGIYPAIDPIKSLSRLMPKLVDNKHMEMAMFLRELMSSYESMEDLVNMGLYSPGSNPIIDLFLEHKEDIIGFFKQDFRQKIDFEQSIEDLKNLYEKLKK